MTKRTPETNRREWHSQRHRDKNAEAVERNEHWQGLTPKQKIKALDKRLGKDKGAKRQRERINVKIESESPAT